ncbi:N-acetyltransferase, GNAT family [Geotalea daltonii FRC-32]|uniref:N-acetyltransferase, GNAT family n=1 Tax=Geotalea daltonii (strain DSM 22248 / JCM 15807 / FRC-32) TaxID=316067 RepID=B9M0T9_GEODF|nr:GNAT family N-acetyltransferase [Geotalea daltonii]ACM20942.1 N-acetyltransferase, GNAT family [Geotalea daltonii FRC-32]
MRPEVTIEPFRPYQVPLFLALAAKEGWKCGQWEFDFLLENFGQGCWVARHNQHVAGFVTSVKYGKSGWIGNLLVRAELRGQGLGRFLMEQAIASLDRAGTETIWLTASRSGRPLYEKLGFFQIDMITRWRGSGDINSRKLQQGYTLEMVEELDQLGWGDHRSLIIRKAAEQGTVLSVPDGFCMVQNAGGTLQLGPWCCRSLPAAENLLEQALTMMGQGDVFLDVPDSNGNAAFILRKRGFTPCGGTVLMYRGASPAYRSQLIYALATMGSIG